MIEWQNFGYRDLFYLARYTPQFFDHDVNVLTWGLNGLQDWLAVLAMALIGAISWTYFDRKRKEYDDLYYLLRVILRYRLALESLRMGLYIYSQHIFPIHLSV